MEIIWILIMSLCIAFDVNSIVYKQGNFALAIFAVIICSIALILNTISLIKKIK